MHDADGIALADHAKAAVFLEQLNRSEAVYVPYRGKRRPYHGKDQRNKVSGHLLHNAF